MASPKSKSDQFSYLNSEGVRKSVLIQQVVVPSIQYVTALYNSTFINYLGNNLDIEKAIFAAYLCFIIFVFVFLWAPYLRNLNVKIWRTKGMLNMIPMDLIGKNENLKTKFISGDLLQAVK